MINVEAWRSLNSRCTGKHRPSRTSGWRRSGGCRLRSRCVRRRRAPWAGAAWSVRRQRRGGLWKTRRRLRGCARADAYTDAAAAERTRIARARDWDAFSGWCDSLGLSALPAEADTLRCYLTHLVQQGRKASTIRRACCSIGLRHEQSGLPRPDQTCRTRQVERGIARVFGSREVGATPVLQPDLVRLVEHLDGSARALRDCAILLLGFAGGFRASELVAMRVEDLDFGEDGVVVLVPRGKQDPLGRGKRTAVPRGVTPATCPIMALERWLERVGRPSEGLLFRRIDGEQTRALPMGERAASRAVQRAVARVGLVGKYSSHSLRAGFAPARMSPGVRCARSPSTVAWTVRRPCTATCIPCRGAPTWRAVWSESRRTPESSSMRLWIWYFLAVSSRYHL
jgi:integrase